MQRDDKNFERDLNEELPATSTANVAGVKVGDEPPAKGSKYRSKNKKVTLAILRQKISTPDS